MAKKQTQNEEVQKAKAEEKQPVDQIQLKEEGRLPSYLERALEKRPVGGDNGVVYAGDYGWVCEYPDGTKELLEELTGLAGMLKRYGRDKFGKPFAPGAVISTNLTVEVLNMLSDEDIKILAEPLGITEGTRAELIQQLTEKLQIK